MTNKEMLEHMFQLQEQLNVQIRGENWRDQNLPWNRAIWTECAELLESMNWKWWKEDPIDMNNIRVELVDIWHFGMSTWLQKELSHTVDYHPTIIKNKELAISYIETLALSALMGRTFPYTTFFELCVLLDFPLSELYKLYIGKQILNRFRNDNGYTKGTYKKNWDGKEDNKYLYQYCDRYSDDLTDFETDLYEYFTEIYKQLCGCTI
jgi:dimeric dUTPase (all-alpha-NTP-PPase superfamily)